MEFNGFWQAVSDGLLAAKKDLELPQHHMHYPHTDGCEWYCIAAGCPDPTLNGLTVSAY